jgi:SAM-dependent methyltransferase
VIVPKDRKAAKLARIANVLQCPLCGTRARHNGRAIVCAEAHSFAIRPTAYDFLTDELRAASGVEPTDNVSAHGYDPIALDIIARNGFVLDAGAGLRNEYFPNVVNLEVVAYETTDVLCVGERLPFADGTFDAVLSLNVLEHLRDPFVAAREIVRVMRPGGELYCVWPFLQPYHGYPNHYYNATLAGLRNVFADLEIERAEVAGAGVPIFALTWIVRWWLESLPPPVAQRFAAMTVAELAVEPYTLLAEPFVTDVPPQMQELLACANMIVARKPEQSNAP